MEDKRKWNPCTICGINGVVLKSAGQVNGKTTFFRYDYICVNCGSDTSQNNVPQNEETAETTNDFSTIPFNDEFNIPLEVTTYSENKDEPIKYSSLLPKGKKFLHVNINGLRNKFEEVEHLLINEKDIVVFAITESKLSDSDHANMYNVNGYNSIRLDRPNSKRGGGLMVYVNSNFDHQKCELPFENQSFVECTLFKLSGRFFKTIYVCALYIPPDKIDENVFEFLRHLFCFLRSEELDFIVMGDFNIDLINFSIEKRKLINICKEFNVAELINMPTRVATRKLGENNFAQTATLLDHIYVSDQCKFQFSKAISFSTTDHHLTYTVFKKMKIKIPPKIISYRCMRKIDPEKFKEDFLKIDWNFLNNPKTQNECAIIFEKAIMGLVEKHAPLKRKMIKGTNAPWFTAELVDLCLQRNECRKKSLIDNVYIEEYKKLKNTVSNKIRLAKKLFYKNQFDKVNKSEDVWKVIDRMIQFRIKSSEKIKKLVDTDGKDLESDESICNKFAKEFIVSSAISNVCDLSELVINYENEYNMVNETEDVSVTTKEIFQAMKCVKKCKNTDSNIPKYIFKQFANLFILPFQIVLCKIFASTLIPDNFKIAYAIPLYKGKGKYTQSSSYRAIFNFPFVVKVFERILYCRLLVSVYEFLDPNQHGFKMGYSCETAVGILTQKLYESVDKRKGKSVAIFIDFSKAFDSVNQKKLILKLMTQYKNKLPPYLIKMLYNYFQNRKFVLKNGDYISNKYNIQAGVPPGSILGSLFYSLYVNDISSAINLDYLLYCDDLVIYTECKNYSEGRQKLTECLEKLVIWCNENGLKLNVEKTKWMVFCKNNDFRSKKEEIGELYVDGKVVERVQIFKYLGVIINSHLTFKEHEDQVEKRINSALAKLYSIKRFLSVNVMKTMLSAYVVSIVDYALIIWGVNSSKLVSLQRKINRFVLAYFLPSYYRKRRRKSKVDFTKIEVNDLLKRINLFTISERKILAILKFVFKKRRSLFKGYFEKSKKESEEEGLHYDFRLKCPNKPNSELYKQSIHWYGVFTWNNYYKSFVITDLKRSPYDVFLEICYDIVLKERCKIYV